MTQVVQLGDFTIDSDKLKAYNKQAQDQLTAAAKHKEDAKECELDFGETVEAISKLTKIPKGEVSKYLKARYEENHPKKDDGKPVGTKVAINRGELYTVLNSSLAV